MVDFIFDVNGLASEPGNVTVYNYDSQSGEYINMVEEYLPQGVGVPANATTVAPPVVKAGNAAIFCKDDWHILADHRGESIYKTEDGAVTKVSELGDYPAGTTTLKPATEFDKWDGEKWVTDRDAMNIAQIKVAEARRRALLAEAQVKISIWQTELQLGIIDNEDKAKLTDWLSYIKALQKIDSSAAPDIEWPEVPAQ
ncbi:tail fiber assembly protein [Pantoea latae]|uniref:Phage tail protein n=1 Tax=Pantoea latae TaxID=1964541 RepID=A0A1V9DAT7_9GAMM|nr:tail fiber assembly protein [Pantoea latae]OQP31002.1 phage tail protein [Pantoea latae]